MTRKLKIRDLTLRDGQQSMFATRLKQESIDKLLPFYKEAGFYAIEVWGGAVPDSVMRYLGECPWNRLRSVSKAMEGKSLLTALSRGRNLFGYVPYPNYILEGFYKEAIKNGLNVMRIFDALNDLNNVKESIKLINNLGGIPDAAICYTVDPKIAEDKNTSKCFFARLFSKRKNENGTKIFTDDYFITKAKAMAEMGAKIITIKDMAGLITPLRVASLMPKLKANINVPIDFHTHCTPGYGLASSLMAMIHGVDILDTNIWYFGEGSAAPALELIYIFATKLGIEVEVNMEAVSKIRTALKAIRLELKDYDLGKNFPDDFDPINTKLPSNIDSLFDEAINAAKTNDEETLLDACHKIEQYFKFPQPNLIVKTAEVPGGMYSNMVAQLRQLKQEDVLQDAMALIPKVRKDAGLVPLVTPTSQIVGSQAVSLALDRKKGKPDYSNVSNQFISLIRGEYGDTPSPIDPEFRLKITGDAQEHPYDVNSYKKPENPVLPEFDNVKLAVNDEEYLLLELLPAVATGFLRKRRETEYKNTHKGTDVEVSKKVEEPKAAITGPTFDSPMGGKIIEIYIKPGDEVNINNKLLVYEAMKMENDLLSDRAGKVKRVLVNIGDIVSANQALVEFED